MKTYDDIIEGITKPVSRAEIAKVVNSVKRSVVRKPLSIEQIAKLLSNAINKKWKTVVTIFAVSSRLDQGELNLNGMYDWTSETIEIQLLHHPDDKVYHIEPSRWDKFADGLTNAIQHELLHHMQYVNRDHQQSKKFTRYTSDDIDIMGAQEYLGNDDEIEAFGLNIANELLSYFKDDKEKVLTALRHFRKLASNREASVNLFAYMVAFGFNEKSPVIRKLVKKIVQYVQSS